MSGIPRARLVLAALLGVPAMFAGCHCQSCSCTHATGGASSAAPSASAAPKRKRSTHLRPLTGPAEQRLGASGASGASVQIPVGATDSRPVLIVLSSADPEVVCRTWRGVSQGYGFVLCSGTGSKDQRPDIPSTEKRLRAALHELRHRFGNYISPGAVVIAGVDGSARLTPSLVKQEPAYFARVVLVDGGFQEWSSGVATIFATHGGKRAAFVCTRPGCAAPAGDAAVLSRRAGAKARSVKSDAGVAGAGVLSSTFQWLVEGDPDWKPPRAKPR